LFSKKIDSILRTIQQVEVYIPQKEDDFLKDLDAQDIV